MVAATASAPLAVLQGSFWATSHFVNTKLWLYEDWMAIETPALRRREIERVRYDYVASVEVVAGRLFSDVIVRTLSNTEFIVDGIPNGQLDEARPVLEKLAAIIIGALR
jgi:hypothetical protein